MLSLVVGQLQCRLPDQAVTAEVQLARASGRTRGADAGDGDIVRRLIDGHPAGNHGVELRLEIFQVQGKVENVGIGDRLCKRGRTAATDEAGGADPESSCDGGFGELAPRDCAVDEVIQVVVLQGVRSSSG